ncbi:hypothetical protein ES703_15112 [subsurface metagenome]
MANEYKVLKITEMIGPSDTEGVEKFYRHSIRTRGGVMLSVDISKDDFTAENAAPILKARAQEADKILQL